MAAAVVTISDGALEGAILDNVLGGKYYSFKGIPYAAPPVGDLRFKAPQPPNPWQGLRSAKEHGTVFKQFDINIKGIRDGSEDSLFLNVYSPNLKPTKPLPVMVWIHGGAFLFGHGDSSLYGPDFLVDKDVVVVTFNYRLGALGFLCLHTEDVPGNAGMKDQVAALRWIQKNICHFGGDPNNVTIFGESAGAASVSFHLVSPMSKGLFKRAILQSGASTNYWATAFEPKQRAIKLARELGKDTEDDNELYEFFKTVPEEAFIMKQPKITFSEVGGALTSDLYFNIVSEKEFSDNERFFYGDQFDILSNGIHEGVEVMLGYNLHEGVIGIQRTIPMSDHTEINHFLEYFVPKHLRNEIPIVSQMEIGRKLRDFYCNGTKVNLENMLPLVNFRTFDMFVFDQMQVAKACVKSKTPIFVYKFCYLTERNFLRDQYFWPGFMKDVPLVCHADDNMYLFDSPMKPLNKESKSLKYIDNMTKLWSNFAKNGYPTPDQSLGVSWTPYSNDESYLNIADPLTMKKKPDEEELKLWENIFREHLPKALA